MKKLLMDFVIKIFEGKTPTKIGKHLLFEDPADLLKSLNLTKVYHSGETGKRLIICVFKINNKEMSFTRRFSDMSGYFFTYGSSQYTTLELIQYLFDSMGEEQKEKILCFYNKLHLDRGSNTLKINECISKLAYQQMTKLALEKLDLKNVRVMKKNNDHTQLLFDLGDNPYGKDFRALFHKKGGIFILANPNGTPFIFRRSFFSEMIGTLEKDYPGITFLFFCRNSFDTLSFFEQKIIEVLEKQPEHKLRIAFHPDLQVRGTEKKESKF